jgi:hypothetical protein
MLPRCQALLRGAPGTAASPLDMRRFNEIRIIAFFSEHVYSI